MGLSHVLRHTGVSIVFLKSYDDKSTYCFFVFLLQNDDAIDKLKMKNNKGKKHLISRGSFLKAVAFETTRQGKRVVRGRRIQDVTGVKGTKSNQFESQFMICMAVMLGSIDA